ncbi:MULTISPECIES: TetR/AcrR family transcriptional regulator [Microbacterium]|uniref:TetR/AcrR family transcriptional regulator n=1 Tax=Microbacterium TaxID=33882 RepID=UPI00146DB537|nr:MULTISPECIES: TetR/AcrR family transcriptional regulator [Microbacterium]
MSIPARPRRKDAVAKAAAIEAAAVDLVLELGYDAVTVDMICARAGVSQRTFFNHFKTKDNAVIGPGAPSIDERAARAFIVSASPLLEEAIGLIRIDAGAMAEDPRLLARRIRAVATNPILMARQMERLVAIEHDLREIIELRLRTQYPDESTEQLGEQAEIITHVLAGVMRYIGQSWARQVEEGGAPTVDPATISASLSAAVRKLA